MCAARTSSGVQGKDREANFPPAFLPTRKKSEEKRQKKSWELSEEEEEEGSRDPLQISEMGRREEGVGFAFVPQNPFPEGGRRRRREKKSGGEA